MRPQDTSDGTIVTESYGGRQHAYRDVTGDLMRRSSKRSSRRSATTTGSPSSRGSPTSAGPSIVEVRPAAPMPPPAVPSGRSRVSFEVDSPRGTAFYNSPSLDLPRAFHNERSPRQSSSTESFSSTSATVDETVHEAAPLPLRFDVSSPNNVRRGYTSSRGSPSSPGLSELPDVQPRKSKHDSAKSFMSSNGRGNDGRPRAETSESGRRREQSQADADAARFEQQKEDDRQAGIERARMAAYDRRQEERRAAAEQSSRERHREEAAATLQGIARQSSQADSELAQIAHERREAHRKRNSQQYPPRSSIQSQRRSILDDQPYKSPLRSPISARGDMSLKARSPTSPPVVHNNYPPPIDPTLRPATLDERGANVLARERAYLSRDYRRSPTERASPQYQTRTLEDAVERMTFEDDFVLFDDEGTYEEVEPHSPLDRRGGGLEKRPRNRRSDYHS